MVLTEWNLFQSSRGMACSWYRLYIRLEELFLRFVEHVDIVSKTDPKLNPNPNRKKIIP